MRKLSLILGAGLIGGGLALVAWFGWPHFAPAEPPYRYLRVSAGQADAIEDLGLENFRVLDAQAYEIRQRNDDAVLARLVLAETDDRHRVLMRWESFVGEPLLTVTGEIPDVARVGEAIAAHAAPETPVLAWWDTSRQLELMSGRNVFFRDHLSRPLIVPSPWRERADVIAEAESAFWRTPPEDAPANREFSAFADALLSRADAGVDQLNDIAGNRFILVVHALDAFKLGALAPTRFAIGYKDFPNAGQLHGLIAKVKDWLQAEGYESYLAVRNGERGVRVYYLMDADAEASLIARLLPFSTSDPTASLPGLGLALQRGNYWVYIATR